ncbi:MAG: hypothetical protein ACYC9O_16590 [Candidatus Latescibacterota bacterium]
MEMIAALLLTAFGTPSEVTSGDREIIKRELGITVGEEGLIFQASSGMPDRNQDLVQLSGEGKR